MDGAFVAFPFPFPGQRACGWLTLFAEGIDGAHGFRDAIIHTEAAHAASHAQCVENRCAVR